ncbi:hypothetical protein BABINDRAFT_6881 [Babjeviella inositovora NRRL Y-12698]|uniref:Very-long-chain (3R)-3-hydroxyacyl-CoA dehydratase n=1 Tax=Babjeviella inositovora NRRL Y-12698 TaxID=984486 RepID=A0A1E3QVD5_9ASCO|nr:uncharacterized protein BABINDRAFT_6881 [Babjeviella inositovora NRRL Y-12698]ODQ81032.1 hypothetical protein BABINDRAFT_6881 [Babjeviella inositovora NRRL Y-12698]
MASSTPTSKPGTITGLYLYNVISGNLWAYVLLSTVVYRFAYGGQPLLFEATHFKLIIIQSLALIEVFNSATGIVKSPLFTTLSQVASRLLIVWGFFYAFPNSEFNRTTTTYFSLVVSWAVTEIIRYQYYALNLSSGGKPNKILTWLRYNAFLVLYPSGVFSELAIIYGNIPACVAAFGGSQTVKWGLYAVMAVYAPGFYVLFGHMLKQRSKVMKSLRGDRVKKAN